MALFYFCCAEFFGILRYLAVAATTFLHLTPPRWGLIDWFEFKILANQHYVAFFLTYKLFL